MTNRAFTLIELLIVVAIIAILAAIAVPNFLEAQTRAKISRNRADMRTAVTALETYRIDHNKYVYDGYNRADTAKYNYWFLSYHISTPISYLTTAKLPDPFRPKDPNNHWQYDDVRYINTDSTWGTVYDDIQSPRNNGTSSYHDDMTMEFGGYRLQAAGPDGTYGPNGWIGVSAYPPSSLPQPYDATNGTTSKGDIIRSQADPENGYKNAS